MRRICPASHGVAMAQVRNLYADPALIGLGASRLRHLVWIGAAALYFVVSYPYQGVLYTWCGQFAQAVFVVLCGVSTVALLSQRASEFWQYRIAAPLAITALALTMLVTLAAHGNLTVVRELLLLAVTALAFRATMAGDLAVVRALIYVSSAALVPAILVTGMFYANWIDWPTWSVDHLDLADSNPLKIRQEWADFDYYLPFWIAVVPHSWDVADQGFGLHLIRQSFLYMEP